MKFLFLVIATSIVFTARAQHHHMPDTTKKPVKETRDSSSHNHESMPGMDMEDMEDMDVPMTHSYSLNLPMNRNGSGTGWLPDSSPMYGYMAHSKKWMFMVHGNIFVRYDKQDISGVGSRGGEKWDAPNWLMFMGQTKLGTKGLFHFGSMFSLDYVVAGGSGYPLLFQSGETYQAKDWALQVSHGFIKSPEEIHAAENINRTTASVVFSQPFKKRCKGAKAQRRKEESRIYDKNSSKICESAATC